MASCQYFLNLIFHAFGQSVYFIEVLRRLYLFVVAFQDSDGFQVDEILCVTVALVNLLHFAELVTDKEILFEGMAG